MKTIRRILSIALAGVLSIGLFTACGGEEEKTPDVSAVLTAVVESQTLEDMMDGNDDEFSFRYDIDMGDVEGYAMTYCGNGAIADEITVVKAKDKEAVNAVKAVFEKRIEKRTNDFAGYVPEEEAKLKKSTVEVHGNYVILLICPDNAAAKKAVDGCF